MINQSFLSLGKLLLLFLHLNLDFPTVKFPEASLTPYHFVDKRRKREGMGGQRKVIEIVRAENLSSQLEGGERGGDPKRNFSQKIVIVSSLINMNSQCSYQRFVDYFLHLQQIDESSSAFVSGCTGPISYIYRLGDIFANGGPEQNHTHNMRWTLELHASDNMIDTQVRNVQMAIACSGRVWNHARVFWGWFSMNVYYQIV